MSDDIRNYIPPEEAERLSKLADDIETSVDGYLDETFAFDRSLPLFHIAMQFAFERLVAKSFNTMATKAIKTMKEKRKS